MNQLIKDDLYRYEGRYSFMLLIRYILFTPGFRYTFFMRKVAGAQNVVAQLFWNVCLRIARIQTSIQIPAATKIGKGLYIGHFGTIVVNPNAVIGANFSISPGCLIGNSAGKMRGVPTLGNSVKMGANSIVIGGVAIGDNVLIAPNAFVNFDVPSNSICIGNPAKITRRNNPTSKYIVYPVK